MVNKEVYIKKEEKEKGKEVLKVIYICQPRNCRKMVNNYEARKKRDKRVTE